MSPWIDWLLFNWTPFIFKLISAQSIADIFIVKLKIRPLITCSLGFCKHSVRIKHQSANQKKK